MGENRSNSVPPALILYYITAWFKPKLIEADRVNTSPHMCAKHKLLSRGSSCEQYSGNGTKIGVELINYQ